MFAEIPVVDNRHSTELSKRPVLNLAHAAGPDVEGKFMVAAKADADILGLPNHANDVKLALALKAEHIHDPPRDRNAHLFAANDAIVTIRADPVIAELPDEPAHIEEDVEGNTITIIIVKLGLHCAIA